MQEDTLVSLYNYLAFGFSNENISNSPDTLIERSVFGIKDTKLHEYNKTLLALVDCIPGFHIATCYFNNQLPNLHTDYKFDRLYLYRFLFDDMTTIAKNLEQTLDISYANNYVVLRYQNSELIPGNLYFSNYPQIKNLHYVVEKGVDYYQLEANKPFNYFLLLTQDFLNKQQIQATDKFYIYLFGLANSSYLEHETSISIDDVFKQNYIRNLYGFVTPYYIKTVDTNLLFDNNQVKIRAQVYRHREFFNPYNDIISEKFKKQLERPILLANLYINFMDNQNLNKDLYNIQSFLATITRFASIYPRGMHVDTYDTIFDNRNSLFGGNIVLRNAKANGIDINVYAIKLPDNFELDRQLHYFSLAFYEFEEIPLSKIYSNYIDDLVYDFDSFKVEYDLPENIQNLCTATIREGNKTLTGIWKYSYLGTKRQKHFISPISVLSYNIELEDTLEQKIITLYEFDICPQTRYRIIDADLPFEEEIKYDDLTFLLLRIGPGLYQIMSNEVLNRINISCDTEYGDILVRELTYIYKPTIKALLEGKVSFHIHHIPTNRYYEIDFKLNLALPFTSEYIVREMFDRTIEELFITPAITSDSLQTNKFMLVNYYNASRLTEPKDAYPNTYVCSTSDTSLAFAHLPHILCLTKDACPNTYVCSTSDTSLAFAHLPHILCLRGETICYYICKDAFDIQQLENMLKDNLLVYIHELYRLVSSAMLLPYTDTEIRDLQINHNTYYAVRM
jgi:hypothetical protein